MQTNASNWNLVPEEPQDDGSVEVDVVGSDDFLVVSPSGAVSWEGSDSPVPADLASQAREVADEERRWGAFRRDVRGRGR